jgi:DNA-binding CsgD family transcriptional regulator
LIHEGYTDSKISEQLNISQNTVRTHRQNMRKKFKAKNTPDMLRKAAQQNFL